MLTKVAGSGRSEPPPPHLGIHRQWRPQHDVSPLSHLRKSGPMIQEIDEPSALRPALERIMFEYGRLTLSADIIAMQKLAIAESARLPDLAAAFYVAIDATQIALERFIQRQCDRGHLDFDDVRLAADVLRGMTIMGPTRAVMFHRRAVPEAEEIAHRANVCVRLFLDGCNRARAAS